MSLARVGRVIGCLEGVAVGDAVGKQSEMLAHEAVRRHYPHGIGGFEGRPGAVVPRYKGNARHEWRIGETTDDTERTLAVARAILTTGTVSHVSIGSEMLRCTKSVHPGVKSLWDFHQAADSTRTTTEHEGCGAAIRVAPVGILYRSDRLDELVSGAREASISTHGGSLAIAGAASTAAAVSAAIDGASPADVFGFAEHAAKEAERRWPGPMAPTFAPAMRSVYDALGRARLRPAEVAARFFPNQPLTIVPLALGLATRMRSAEDAILLAANIGGDSDSVGSIAGAILGAIYPNTVNQQWYEIVERINHLDLVRVANELAALRH
ncbi:MAG TPA: ADP-ribosylglycohydrolase family protein [Vicinamibacterales bacterium]|jgi:ADP-ribosylglycohydrolase|nr:ADP-ribosylglycohydrolase family protein [Vicinamibacterales bacterium]